MRTYIGIAYALAATLAYAQTEKPSEQPDVKEKPVEQIEVIETEAYRFVLEKRIRSVDGHDPEIIDVQAVGPSELRFLGQEIGTTRIKIRDEDDKESTFDIVVRPSTRDLDATLRKLFPELKFKLVPVRKDVLVLRGHAESVKQSQQVVDVCETFFSKVLNQLRVGNSRVAAPGVIPPGMRVITIKPAKPKSTRSEAMDNQQIRDAFDRRQRIGIRSTSGSVVLNGVQIFAVDSNAQKTDNVSILVTTEQARQLASAKPGEFTITRTGSTALRQEVRDLHKDVKKLIQLLEEKSTKKTGAFQGGGQA